MFPLYSLAILLVLIAGVGSSASSSVLYGAIATINGILLVVISLDTSDYVIWFIVFEASVISVVSCLTVEGRSFRRLYAFIAMLIVTFVGGIGVYAGLTDAISSYTSAGSLFSSSSTLVGASAIAVSLVVIGKIPLFPLSFWLPEAHVEATGPGSVVLAGYSLKFATVGMITFMLTTNFVVSLEIFTVLAIVSVLFGTVAISSTNDAKKIVANLSIVHMAATFALALSVAISTETLVTFSGHHHSVITGIIFAIIGFSYVHSGSRLIRFLVGNPQLLPIMSLLLFGFATISLDLPWTSNIAVEIAFIGTFLFQFPVVVLFSLVCLLGFVISAILSATTAKSSSSSFGNSTIDLGSTWNFSLVSAAIVVVIGFSAMIWNTTMQIASIIDHRNGLTH